MVRAVLTVVGAAAMVGGAFLSWLRLPAELASLDTSGTSLSYSVFYSTDDPSGAGFFTSAGFVAIVLGALAIAGLLPRSPWLTWLAGLLGVVALVLFAITIMRLADSEVGLADIGIGAWLVGAGGLVAVIGGFSGGRSGEA